MSKLNNWFVQTEYDCSILLKNYFEDIVSTRNGYTGVSYGSGCIYSQGLINGDGTLSAFIPEINENIHIHKNLYTSVHCSILYIIAKK